MTDPEKAKRVSGDLSQDTKKLKKEPPAAGDICEICGATLECDPESGECYCPECFFSDIES